MKTSELPIGFTPVRNRRIEKSVAATAAELVEAGNETDYAWRTARQQVARNLPPLPFARRHRMPKPSKSDCPIYRKVAVA